MTQTDPLQGQRRVSLAMASLGGLCEERKTSRGKGAENAFALDAFIELSGRKV